jgi:hypothetical protein
MPEKQLKYWTQQQLVHSHMNKFQAKAQLITLTYH